jgi:hypothetical protein
MERVDFLTRGLPRAIRRGGLAMTENVELLVNNTENTLFHKTKPLKRGLVFSLEAKSYFFTTFLATLATFVTTF